MLFRTLHNPLGVGFRALFVLVAGLAFSSSTVAQTPQDPGVTTPASPFASSPPYVPASTDLSAPDVFVVYPVTINNGGGSAINSIRISGTAASDSLAIAASFDTVSTAPFTCTPNTTLPSNSISFTCVAPAYSLATGQKLTLPVTFKMPKVRSEGNFVSFNFTALFREGLGGGSSNSDSILTGFTNTLVNAVSNESVAAVIPLQTGARFFTGRKGVPQGVADSVATIVDAPTAAGTYATATIAETALATCPVSNSKCKDQISLSILDENGNKQRFEPNSVTDPLSQYLLVTLRRDASAFKGSVNNIVIYYNGGTGYETVPPCINGNDPLLGLGDRCVYDRRVFKRGDPEVVEDPALLGDAQVRVLAKQNGEWFW